MNHFPVYSTVEIVSPLPSLTLPWGPCVYINSHNTVIVIYTYSNTRTAQTEEKVTVAAAPGVGGRGVPRGGK